MGEQADASARVLRVGLPDLAGALEALREPPEDDDDEAALIRFGIGVMRRFYKAFFDEVFGADVNGFGWKEKHRAVAAIIEKEDVGSPQLDTARTDVASLFEDLSDALHGDLEFGYSNDVALIRAFAEEYLQSWTDAVFKWLTAVDENRATSLRTQLDEEQRRVAADTES